DLRERDRGVRPGQRVHPDPDHRGRPVRLSGGAGAVPAGGQPGLPVGEPGGDRPPAARAGGRPVDGHRRADPRRAVLDLRPGPGRPGPGAGDRAAAGGVPGPVPGLLARDHRAGDGRRAHRPGRDQRLPVDDAGPGDRVGALPPARGAGPLPGRAARRAGRADAAGLHRGQQRRLPVRVRRLAGGVRGRVRAAVDGAGLADRAAVRAALPGRGHDHRGGRAAVHHAGPVRRGLPRPLQVQPAEADRAAGAVGVRAGPLPDAGIRRHRRLRPHQAALLRGAPGHQPDRDRSGRAGPVRLDDAARPGVPRRPPLRRRHPARPGPGGGAGAGGARRL
ncbi:MAG: Glutathione S-transferase, omega, partial [uncultured Corynebacteriales bacterium]